MFGKRLSRQLRKIFDQEVDAELAVVLESPEHLQKNLREVFKLVDESYEQLDLKLSLAQSNLEHSQKELVDKNSNLVFLNSTFDAILNSLNDGILTFDGSGVCGTVYSHRAEVLLQESPSEKFVWDLLGFNINEKEDFKNWVTFVFEESLPFSRCLSFGPQRSFLNGRIYDLNFRPILDEGKKIKDLLMVITERTEEVLAKKMVADLQNYSEQIVSILRNRNSFKDYVENIFSHQISYESKTQKNQNLDSTLVLRWLHDMKAASGFFSLNAIRNEFHGLETQLSLVNENLKFSQVLNRSLAKISEDLLKVLASIKEDLEIDFLSQHLLKEISETSLRSFHKRLASLDSEVARSFLSEFILESMAEQVHCYLPSLESVSRRNQKPTPEIFVLGDFKIDREKYADFFRAFVHVFTNCVVHGIEAPEIRVKKNKAEKGRITVNLKESDQNFEILVSDDGQGIDTVALKQKVLQRGLVENIDCLSDGEIWQMIFLESVSLRATVDQDSGRGVGLSSLKKSLEEISGTIKVTGTDSGCQFFIVIPKRNE